MYIAEHSGTYREINASKANKLCTLSSKNTWCELYSNKKSFWLPHNLLRAATRQGMNHP